MNAKLQIVDGLAPSRQRLPAGSWKTILEFLIERHPRVSIETWLARMDRGLVVDESGSRLCPSSSYRAGACVFYYREVEVEPRIPFDERVLYADDHILVADKPHFLPVMPAGRFVNETLLVRLKRRSERWQNLVPLHRIDRETAGLVLFSVDRATRGRYASMFQARRIEKTYEALAQTNERIDFPLTRRSRLIPGEPFFRMTEVEGEPNSETHIDVIERSKDASLYELKPVTGKKHQLRVHLAAIGIPIVGDKLYPNLRDAGDDDFADPLRLLARSISFRDPLTNRERRFESTLRLQRVTAANHVG